MTAAGARRSDQVAHRSERGYTPPVGRLVTAIVLLLAILGAFAPDARKLDQPGLSAADQDVPCTAFGAPMLTELEEDAFEDDAEALFADTAGAHAAPLDLRPSAADSTTTVESRWLSRSSLRERGPPRRFA